METVGLTTKLLLFLSLPSNDKIRDRIVANRKLYKKRFASISLMIVFRVDSRNNTRSLCEVGFYARFVEVGIIGEGLGSLSPG